MVACRPAEDLVVRSRFRRYLIVLLEIATPLAVIGLWQLQTRDEESLYYPPPFKILEEFRDIWLFDRAGTDFVPSLSRMLLGFVIGCGIGYLGGVALALGPRFVLQAVDPIIEFLRAIPPPAFLPFAIVVFGVDQTGKIFIIALGCLFPVLLNTMDGVREVDPLLYDVCASYDVRGRREVIGRVILPASLPRAFAGLQTSLAVALILMVISEMYASSEGVGRFILESQRTFAIRPMWAGIVLLGLLGFLLNAVLRLVEGRALRWYHAAHGGSLR
jgi:ABC-type nitrate/sulfonate/bicarbonate transport system permease component